MKRLTILLAMLAALAAGCDDETIQLRPAPGPDAGPDAATQPVDAAPDIPDTGTPDVRS